MEEWRRPEGSSSRCRSKSRTWQVVESRVKCRRKERKERISSEEWHCRFVRSAAARGNAL